MAARIHFAAGYDGSRLAERALDYMGVLVKNRGEGKASVMHIKPTAAKLKLLPANLSEQNLQDKATGSSSKLVELGGKYELEIEWLVKQKTEGSTTGTTLCDLVHEAKVDVTCVGSYGRKEKSAENDLTDPAYQKHDSAQSLGTTSLVLLKALDSDVLVVKHNCTIPAVGDSLTWMVATDSSENGYHAVDRALAMMGPTDKLIIYKASAGTVGSAMTGDGPPASWIAKRQEFYTAHCALAGKECEFICDAVQSGGLSVGDMVVAKAHAAEVNVLVIGQKGHGYAYGMKGKDVANLEAHAKLGSVSTAVVTDANGPAILITKGEAKW